MVRLFKQMAELYSFVDDITELLSAKIERLESTIVRVLEQTTECAIFIREYTDHGFVRKCLLMRSERYPADTITKQLGFWRKRCRVVTRSYLTSLQLSASSKTI